MRNALLVLLVGPLLYGCSDPLQPSTNGNDSGATQSPTENSVPTIGGNPPRSVKFGETYSFRPDAVDADGDALTFKVENKPAWASFDPTTGTIYGKPSPGDVGFYNNIIIGVTDSKSSALLPVFSITVSQSAMGSVTLSWIAPTMNSDGSPLKNLAGYKIYYRRNSDSDNQQIRVNNPGTTIYVIENLSPGTYYFSATAFNTSGLESSFSAEVMKTVD